MTLRRLLGSERLWATLGILLALLWFTQTLLLPPVYRGMLCCDAADYMRGAESSKLEQVLNEGAKNQRSEVPDNKKMSEASNAKTNLASPLLRVIKLLFSDAGYRPVGYSAFLAMHKYALLTLGVRASTAWVNAASMTALLLHFVAMFFFYRTAKSVYPVHPFAFFLLLAHPGLTSHAAIPLSDSLAISVLLIALCSIYRSLSTHGRESHGLAIGSGALIGLLLWIRSPHFFAVGLLMAGWIVLAALYRSRKALLIACVTALTMGIVLSPRLIACSRASGSLCFTPPAQASTQTFILLDLGLRNIRAYTVAGPEHAARLVTVDDPLLTAIFQGNCTFHEATVTRDLGICLLRHAPGIPLLYAKKLVGLFDNFHWETYATVMTPQPVIVMNRIFGAVGFAGFVFFLCGYAWMLCRKSLPLKIAVPLLYPIVYFAFFALLPIESRYGLPLAPFGIVTLIALWPMGWKLQRWRFLAVTMLLIAVFVAQTVVWDRGDPAKYGTANGEIENTITGKPSPESAELLV